MPSMCRPARARARSARRWCAARSARRSPRWPPARPARRRRSARWRRAARAGRSPTGGGRPSRRRRRPRSAGGRPPAAGSAGPGRRGRPRRRAGAAARGDGGARCRAGRLRARVGALACHGGAVHAAARAVQTDITHGDRRARRVLQCAGAPATAPRREQSATAAGSLRNGEWSLSRRCVVPARADHRLLRRHRDRVVAVADHVGRGDVAPRNRADRLHEGGDGVRAQARGGRVGDLRGARVVEDLLRARHAQRACVGVGDLPVRRRAAGDGGERFALVEHEGGQVDQVAHALGARGCLGDDDAAVGVPDDDRLAAGRGEASRTQRASSYRSPPPATLGRSTATTGAPSPRRRAATSSQHQAPCQAPMDEHEGGAVGHRAHPTFGGDAPLASKPWPVIPSGRGSSTRRRSSTRAAASSSPSSRARSRWPPRRAGATPRATRRSGSPSRRPRTPRCPRTTSSARSPRAPARAPTPRRWRASSTRATARAAWRCSSRR